MKTNPERLSSIGNLPTISSNTRARSSLLVFLAFSLLASTFCSQAQILRASDLSLPPSLVTVATRNEGSPGRLFVVIGETHVKLKVQQNVADLLSYLSAAYGMKLVCTEGTDAFPDLRSITSLPSRQAARKVAEEKLRERQINAVEYFAMTHPQARTVGVEDMKALKAHDAELTANNQKLEAWVKELSGLMENDLANIKVTSAQNARFEKALNDYLKSRDFQKLTPILYELVGRDTANGRKVRDLETRDATLSRINKIAAGTIPSTEDPYFVARDKALVSNSLQAARTEKIVALVVGKLHLYGVEKIMREQHVSFITVVPNGVDDDIKTEPPPGVSKEAWEKQLEQESKVYEDWKKGTASGPIEEYLQKIKQGRNQRLKPVPASSRPSARDTLPLAQLPFTVEEFAKQGKPRDEIQTRLAPFTRAGIKPLDWYIISDGAEVLVEKDGAVFWVILTTPDKVPPPGYDEIASEPVGERKLILCSRGSGSPPRPPFPPVATTPPWNNPDFNRFKNIVIYKEAAGEVWRYIGNTARPLGISLPTLRNLVAAFESAPDGPEKTLAAQKLCDILLLQIEEDLPSDTKAIVQSSQDDVLKKHTMIALASFAGGHQHRRILDLSKNSVANWSDLQQAAFKESLAMPAPKLRAGKIAIWFTRELNEASGVQNTKRRLKDLGFKVNEPLQAGEALVVFGTGTDRPWDVDLSDGSTLRSTEQKNVLGRAQSLASYGVQIADDLRLKEGTVMSTDKLAEKEVAEAAEKVGEALEIGKGEKTLEEALRDKAKTELAGSERLGDLMQKRNVAGELSAGQKLACLTQGANNGY